MVESIALAIVSLGLLVFLFLQKKEEQVTRRSDQEAATKNFAEFIKHIEKLEKMVLPQPVTEKAVKKVLSRIGEVADEPIVFSPNEIEDTRNKGVTLENADWPNVIGEDTKVAFEEDLPTIVE